MVYCASIYRLLVAYYARQRLPGSPAFRAALLYCPLPTPPTPAYWPRARARALRMTATPLPTDYADPPTVFTPYALPYLLYP